jgi:hypothetical protein
MGIKLVLINALVGNNDGDSGQFVSNPETMKNRDRATNRIRDINLALENHLFAEVYPGIQT